MTSKLIDRGNGVYGCSNCMMRQPGFQEHCFWCGSLFYNYQELLVKEAERRIREEIRDESDIHRGN